MMVITISNPHTTTIIILIKAPAINETLSMIKSAVVTPGVAVESVVGVAAVIGAINVVYGGVEH